MLTLRPLGRAGRLFDQDTSHLNESTTPPNGETLMYGVCTESSGRKYEIHETDLTEQITWEIVLAHFQCDHAHEWSG